MQKQLSLRSLLQISFLLFGFFFGAGNLIFPPLMGKLAGGNFVSAILGFAITAVICPVLGILAVAKMGGTPALAAKVSRRFGILFPIVIYLAIGPGLGIPRAGSMPFAMAIQPLLPVSVPVVWARLIYTVLFFALACWLCISPIKMVPRVGKILTPTLLFLILCLFVATLIRLPAHFGPSTGAYQSSTFLNGILDGYNTMDALASLNFGFAIAVAIKSLKLTDDEKVGKKYTYMAAFIAGSLLLIIYAMLTYIGVTTAALWPDTTNGADILRFTSRVALGYGGYLLVITVFSLACLTTCIGLIMSLSQYFSKLVPKISYRAMVILISLISCVLANFGLDAIIKFSLPTLLIMSPVSVVLILLGVGYDFYSNNKHIFTVTIYTCLFFSFVDVINNMNFLPQSLGELLRKLPLSEYSLAWLVPTLLVFVVSFGAGKIFCRQCSTAVVIDQSK